MTSHLGSPLSVREPVWEEMEISREVGIPWAFWAEGQAAKQDYRCYALNRDGKTPIVAVVLPEKGPEADPAG